MPGVNKEIFQSRPKKVSRSGTRKIKQPMSNKQAILEAIGRNKPTPTVLPDLLSFPSDEDLVAKYTQSITLNGGTAIEVGSLEDVQAYIEENFLEGLQIVSLVAGIPGKIGISSTTAASDDETVDLPVLKREVRPVENAAICVPEKHLPHRVLPIIAQHLIIIMEKTKLVSNMH